MSERISQIRLVVKCCKMSELFALVSEVMDDDSTTQTSSVGMSIKYSNF